ncbi:MAG: prolipoprotein diacylglyceryl transferase [Candidatus Omnitrophica bacterium]|nr:prolipoprotein diacylglyceryl transferase [Candidatus Omnitrophota bacterium]
MHPIICHIGPVPLYSYGFMLASALLICSWLTARDAQKIGIPSDAVYDLSFWVVLFGIIGARLFFILLNLDYFAANPLESVMFWKGGLAWQGSMVLGLAATFVYIKAKKLSLGKFLNVVAPYVALGQAIGRIGCLLNGCCYGKPASWGIYFPNFGERLQPTQIYMSLSELAIFLILRAVQPKVKRGGQLFILYLLLASIERFFIEFARADHENLWLGLSVFQYVCVTIFVLATGVNLWLARKAR